MDPVFEPKLTFVTEEYSEDVLGQIEELYHDRILAMEDNYEILYKTEAVLERFDEAIAEYDRMLEKYGVQDNAAVTAPEEPAETEEEAFDEAA
ncbi:MAG: hypothetical protein K6G34_08810 [Lachnospiraceae bacterium]|nr:hypothetical protein [Lachnospiraceae bacterium]